MTPPSPQFFVRWKGKISGPFDRNTLREMLRRGDISLAHQIQVEDHWVSTAEFLEPSKPPSAPFPHSQGGVSLPPADFPSSQPQVAHFPDKARPSPASNARQHVPPFPWLRVATYALLVFVAYTVFKKDLASPSVDPIVQQSTLDIWNEKNSIDQRCASLVDELDRCRKLASAYSKLSLERADPVLSSHLTASIKLYKEGVNLTAAVLADARKLDLKIPEPDLRRLLLGPSQKGQPELGASTGMSGKGIPNLDDAGPLQTLFATHQPALNQWRKEVELQGRREKEVAAELGRKYSIKFRTAN